MSPLPDVSSTIRRGSPGCMLAPGDRACANAASDAMTHSSVSSGEKKSVKRNGGLNARSRAASLSSDGRVTEYMDGRPYEYGTVAPKSRKSRKARLLQKRAVAMCQQCKQRTA